MPCASSSFRAIFVMAHVGLTYRHLSRAAGRIVKIGIDQLE